MLNKNNRIAIRYEWELIVLRKSKYVNFQFFKGIMKRFVKN